MDWPLISGKRQLLSRTQTVGGLCPRCRDLSIGHGIVRPLPNPLILATDSVSLPTVHVGALRSGKGRQSKSAGPPSRANLNAV